MIRHLDIAVLTGISLVLYWCLLGVYLVFWR